jgi:microcompartment protein CcmK/EutM
MTLARVVANVVATEKHPHYKGLKILVVQAGVGDLVLVVDEGGSARAVLGDESLVTIRTAICGIVDRIDIDDGRRAP